MRIGFNSKAVITGDTTQIDLEARHKSGLINACDVLKNIPGISFTHFQVTDVVRHPLVQTIVEAYESHETKHSNNKNKKTKNACDIELSLQPINIIMD